MNETSVDNSIRNIDYIPVIIIITISGVISISIAVYYQIAFYRYSKLSDSEKCNAYSTYDLVFPKKIKPAHTQNCIM
jgi:hypothetical protein